MTERHHEESEAALVPAPEGAADEPAAADEHEPVQPLPPGDPRVQDAVRRLGELADLPPAEHVEIYEAVHSSLQESLAEASRQADESPADGNPSS